MKFNRRPSPGPSGDVVAEMPDPDATPVDLSKAFEAPPRDPTPTPADRTLTVPHCNGRHGIDQTTGHRCEYCDSLTDVISLARWLESANAAKDRRIAALEQRLARLEARS